MSFVVSRNFDKDGLDLEAFSKQAVTLELDYSTVIKKTYRGNFSRNLLRILKTSQMIFFKVSTRVYVSVFKIVLGHKLEKVTNN